MTRIAFATAFLLATVAWAQPVTYPVPIAGRTPNSAPVGANALQTALALPDPGVGADQSLLYGTGSGSSVPFRLDTLVLATVTGFPAQVDAVAAAPGVLVAGSSRTLLAISSGGTVLFGTVEIGTFIARGPSAPVPGTSQLALSAVPDGGAALIVSDGFTLTRWSLDISTGTVTATNTFSGPASPGSAGFTDQSNALFFDGTTETGFIGGRVVGDLYAFDARGDAGPPTVFDSALVGQGRLSPPVTGLAVYTGQTARYLLVASGQGITVYDLLKPNPLTTAFRAIPQDVVGSITAPAGVAVTNLPAGTALPAGVIAVGDRTNTDLAVIRWDVLAGIVDGGLTIDTTFDPRGGGGSPDGGAPDGGGPGGPDGGGPGQPPEGPIGPGVPVDHPSSCTCTSTRGAPGLAAFLAALALLLFPRRQRR